MSIQPDYLPLGELLTNRLFRIPHYQRAYSWQRKQRNDMFDDIRGLEGDPESFHFMATMVGLCRDTVTIRADRHSRIDVVDGQQRLTTLVILLKAIEKKLRCSQSDDADDLQKLLVKGDDSNLILLQTNHDSSRYCSNYLRSGEFPPVEEAQTLADRELLQAIRHCESFVNKCDDPMELLTIVKNQLYFIFHEITDEAAVYTVFEVLNDRGLHVSWLDRFKSRLMSIVFKDNQGNGEEHIEELHRIWGDIYKTVGLQQGLSTEALRFAATLRSPKSVSKPFSEERAVRSLIEETGESTSGARQVSEWMLKVTKAVDTFLGDMQGSREAVTKISHARLLAVAIILRGFSSNEQTALLNKWERITFRIFGLLRKDARTGVGNYVRSACEIQNNSKLSADDILNKIRVLGGSYSIDELLDQAADTNWYNGWESELRYLLFRYEEHLAEQRGQRFNNNQWQRIWEASPSQSIEHIFPQSKGSQIPLEAGQEGIFVHRLGNLLLLPPGLNSGLSNKDPKGKAPCYVQTGLLSAVEIAQTIQEYGWGADQIREREQRMVKWILEQWG